MELLAIFTTAFVVGFSGAMMPGPLLTVTIGESARRGFSAGPLLVLGHAVLELALEAEKGKEVPRSTVVEMLEKRLAELTGGGEE